MIITGCMGEIMKNELLAKDNLVNYKGKIHKITKIGANFHDFTVTNTDKENRKYWHVNYDEIQGVPITEECLERLGATSNNCRDGSWEWGNFRLYWTSQEVGIERYGNHLEVVKYVHQLQNIHHFFDRKIEVSL